MSVGCRNMDKAGAYAHSEVTPSPGQPENKLSSNMVV